MFHKQGVRDGGNDVGDFTNDKVLESRIARVERANKKGKYLLGDNMRRGFPNKRVDALKKGEDDGRIDGRRVGCEEGK